MTNVDLINIAIKTEPLSPESAQEIIASIGQSLSPLQQRTSPSASSSYSRMSPDHKPPSLSPEYSATSSDRREFQSTRPSPMMSFGVVRSTGHEHTTPTNPSATATRSALKSSILSKRKARGEVTPLSTSDDGPREYKLTKREIERKEARKEQNRRAARRCRMKKKRIQLQASQEIQSAMKENVDLKQLVDDLRREVDGLKRIISDHEKSHKCQLSPSSCCVSTTHAKDQSKTRVQTYLHPCQGNANPMTNPLELSQVDNIFQEILNLQSECQQASTVPNHLPTTGNLAILPSTSSTDGPQEQIVLGIDLGDCSSNLPLQCTEKSGNMDRLVQEFIEYENAAETPKVDNEQAESTESFIFPSSQDEHNVKNYIRKTGNSHSKPSFVRNLNNFFTQNEVLPNRQEKQSHLAKKNNLPSNLAVPERPAFSNDTITQASRFLHDPNLSSPIFSCVSPNLVQPVNNNTRVASSNTQNNLINVEYHNIPDDTHTTTTMDDDLSDIPFEDIEALSSQTFLSQNPMCSALPSGETLSEDIAITTSTSDAFSSYSVSSGGFNYQQLSPISTASPSSDYTVPSPGFIQQASPQNLCLLSIINSNNSNNNTNSDILNNLVPVYDYHY